mgnify:CR=1 FL=1
MYKAKGGVFYFFHTQYNVYANALSQDHDKEYFYVYEPNSQKWERFFPDFREFKRAPMPDELRNFLFTVVDYIIPIESGYILITGKNFEGEERSRLVAGTSLVIEAGLTFTVVGKGFYKAGKGVLKAGKNATTAIVKSKKVLKGSAKELEVATEVVVKNADKVELLNKKGVKTAVTGHDKFKNNVSEADAKVVIEVRVPAQVDDAAGKTEASTVLEKEDTIAIYGSNEFAAKAIINANGGFKESKLGADKILAVGFDSGALQQDAIRKGIFVGSVTQDPVQIGYQAVKLAIAAAKGETVKDVDTGSKWYDAKNIDSEEIKALLYE